MPSSAGEFRLFVSAGAFLPPALQIAWEDLGVIVLQGYGSTETGTGTCTTLEDHVPGTVGRPPPGIQLRIADDGEVQFRGPTLFHGYWQAPEKTAEAYTADGWYRTGDIGHLDTGGRLILSGRSRDIIVLPNGFNVYPEDIENALRVAGVRDSVILETRPGRIEAIVLAPGTHGLPQGGDLPGGRAGGLTDDAAAVRRRNRCRGPGGQRDARSEPADRRLATVARRGLPADSHAQGATRPRACLGNGGIIDCRLPRSRRTRSSGRRRRCRDRATAQRSCWSRMRLPAGSRKAQSRMP